MKCARFMSFQNSSTAARTTPVLRPFKVRICSSLPRSVGSHSWWHSLPFHERHRAEEGDDQGHEAAVGHEAHRRQRCGHLALGRAAYELVRMVDPRVRERLGARFGPIVAEARLVFA
eukprot:scaffold7131_cov63-Phaeocystis_antarctica.AAC.1